MNSGPTVTPPQMRLKTFPTAIALSFLVSFAGAETLRVPGDYDTVQRAVVAAAPGDIIQIGEGTFYGNVAVIKPLTIKGEGRDKTRLVGEFREQPVIAARLEGTFTLQDLTVAHGPSLPTRPTNPNSDEPPVELMAQGIEVKAGKTRLAQLTVEEPSSGGIGVTGGLLELEDVSLANCSYGGLTLDSLTPGSRVMRLDVGALRDGYGITQHGSTVEYSKLSFELGDSARGPILVSGPTAVARFTDLEAPLRRKIAWENDASPDGKAKPAPAEESDPSLEEWKKTEREKEQRTFHAETALRPATRALQKQLRVKDDAVAAAAALKDYFAAALKDYTPEDSYFGAPQAVRLEVRYYAAKYGARALQDAMSTWPQPAGAPPEGSFYRRLLASDHDLALAGLAGEAWLDKNRAKATALLSRWREIKSSDPAKKAAAFVAVADEVADFRYSSELEPEAIDYPVMKFILAEVPAFIESAGLEGVKELLQLLAENDTRLVTANHVRNSLTPAQKRALFQLLRGKS